MKKIFVWYRMTRVLECVPCHSFFASCGTDAETLGRFDDSVTDVICGHTTMENIRKHIEGIALKNNFANFRHIQIKEKEFNSFLIEFRRLEQYLD